MSCQRCLPHFCDGWAGLRDACPDVAAPELMERSACLGSLLPYRKVAEVMAKFPPIEPTESFITLRYRTLKVGDHLEERASERAWFEPPSKAECPQMELNLPNDPEREFVVSVDCRCVGTCGTSPISFQFSSEGGVHEQESTRDQTQATHSEACGESVGQKECVGRYALEKRALELAAFKHTDRAAQNAPPFATIPNRRVKATDDEKLQGRASTDCRKCPIVQFRIASGGGRWAFLLNHLQCFTHMRCPLARDLKMAPPAPRHLKAQNHRRAIR